MKSKSLFSMTVLGSFLILLAFPAALSAGVVVSCGTVITTSGTWTVAGPLTSCVGDGVDIQATNVILNLNGYSITGALGNTFSGVSSVGQGNIRIEGYGPGSTGHLGTIAGFGAGIFISGDLGDTIKHVHIISNDTGIQTINGSGENLFAYNTISGNGCGICLNAASKNQIIGNTIAGNSAGISIDSPEGTVMRANTVVKSAGDGLWVCCATDGTSIVDNEFSFNGGNGIDYAGGEGGVTIRRNRISANTLDGISINSECCFLTNIKANTVGYNGANGIAVTTSSVNCTSDNIAIGNGSIGSGTYDLLWDGVDAPPPPILPPTDFWGGNHFDTSIDTLNSSPTLPSDSSCR